MAVKPKQQPLRAQQQIPVSRATGVQKVTPTQDVNVTNETLDVVLTNALDSSTGAIEVIDYAHHEIHSGSHYFYMSHHDLAKAGVDEHLIITPNTAKWSHFEFAVEATAGQIHVELYEAAVVSDIGTLETARNRNRNFSDASTTLVYENPTVTTPGILLQSADYGTANKKISVGGGGRGESEIVLKQNTIYLLRVTEDNVAACVVNLLFDWYEHTNK